MENSNNLVQRQFGAHASDYATSQVHAQGPSLARLLELTQAKRDWLLLDVSTGAGHTALAFAPHVARVIAAEVTPQMLETARKLAKERGVSGLELTIADAQALPFDESAFDLVTNRLALHHYADSRRAIEEMARVCKRGGLVALVDNVVPPDKQSAGYINHLEKVRDPSHGWCYPIVRLEAYLADAKLKVEHSETLRKEIEFEPWADRAGASAETKARLRKWLNDAPRGARDWLTPRSEGEKMLFNLTEAIIVGTKV